MSAQTLFDEMLRVQLAPALRELGFRGSGKTFNLPNEAGDHALFGFQKDRWNTAQACRFTASLAFHLRADWERARVADGWLPAKPTLQHVTPDSWQVRVGFLLDPPHDHWWTVRAEEDILAVSDHVVAVVMDVVVPQLQTRLGGARPPALPIGGWSPDCPWPYCTNPHDLFLDHVDLDAVGGSAADGFGAAALSAAHREVLARARGVEVPRTQAWKVLHISRKRLDEYADRVGAGQVLTLAQLLAVSILGADDLLAAARWSDAAAAVGAWVTQLPDADPAAALVVGEGACAVLPLPEVLALHDAQVGLCVVAGLMGATQRLLDDLSTARLV
jgi:hypothetical protein